MERERPKKPTGIERTMHALNFEQTDRIPIVGGFVRHPEFLAELAGVSLPVFWGNPRKVAIEAFRKLSADIILGLILPSKDSDIGAQFNIISATECKTPEDVVEYIKGMPSLSELRREFDFNQTYNDYVSLMKNGQNEMADMLWIPSQFGSVPSFELSYLFGAENYLMALSLYPEYMKRFFESSGEEAYLRNQAFADATVKENLTKVMWIGQDICDNKGPMVSPDILDEIYFPYVRRAFEPLKDADIRIIWHSDGNIMPIVPQLIEAGVDGFQGFQESVGTKVDLNCLAKFKALSGKRVILVGSVSTTKTLPFGTVEDVEKDIERCIKMAEKREGGFLLNSSSSIGPEVPKENIYALFNYAAKRAFKWEHRR